MSDRSRPSERGSQPAGHRDAGRGRAMRPASGVARRAPHWRDRGAALLSVLMLVSIVSATVVVIMDDMRFALRRLAATEARNQAQWFALGAETFMREVIARSYALDPDRSTTRSPWMMPEATFPIEDGLIQGRIRDASNCFNLNSLISADGSDTDGDGAAAERDRVEEYIFILNGLEAAAGRTEELAHALVDWLDPDTSRYRRGAEDVVYSVMDPPYRPANALMSDVLELRAVAGYDEGVVQALRPLVCAHPDTEPSTLNVNTLQETHILVLRAALGEGFSDADAVGLIASRPEEGYQGPDSLHTEIAELKTWTASVADADVDSPAEETLRRIQVVEKRLGVQTQYYDAHARIFYLETYLEVNSLLHLNPGTGTVTVIARRFGERNG